MHPTSKILLPLDTDTAEKAVAMASALQDHVGGFKIGLELINAAGFGVFDQIKFVAGADVKIFYDCKFHDIPNTVAGAARAAAKRGLLMFNIHASGGKAMMQAAVKAATEGADSAGVAKPLVIAVTVLTSIDTALLNNELGIPQTAADYAVRLARLAQDSGCDGVVASPHEIAAIRDACGQNFCLVIPGIRPVGADQGDQKRVLTPAAAVRAGADYLVIGRPITASADPAAAARAINAEIL